MMMLKILGLCKVFNTNTINENKVFDNFNVDFVRIDILDENIDEINNIINTVKNGKRFEGKDFTNGNLRREI